MRKTIKMLPVILFFSLTTAFAVWGGEGSVPEKAVEYLAEYYNIPEGASVNEMITSLGQEPLSSENPSDEEIIAAGIRIAGLEELALSYLNDQFPEKAVQTLEGEEVMVSSEYAPYAACALDLNLISADAPLDVPEFLYHCLEISGRGRHYLGRVTDDDLMCVLRSALEGFQLFDEETLSRLGNDIVLQGAATGYGLKYAGYDAHFLADYTLKYSHSDFRHAEQLIGLLRSENIDAYIQLEPKVSVYEYLPEWGDPGTPTPSYAVREAAEGRYLCYAVEYDLMIEFDSLEEKERFHELIEIYAKKYDTSFDSDGNLTAKLLAESWWQPLYSSATELENPEFNELTDNVIYDQDGLYSIHSFTLPEDTAAIETIVSMTAPELHVNPVTIYVNPAFMRYITGEDHQ